VHGKLSKRHAGPCSRERPSGIFPRTGGVCERAREGGVFVEPESLQEHFWPRN